MSISSNGSIVQMHYSESAVIKLWLNDWKNGSSLVGENSCVLNNPNGSPKLKWCGFVSELNTEKSDEFLI